MYHIKLYVYPEYGTLVCTIYKDGKIIDSVEYMSDEENLIRKSILIQRTIVGKKFTVLADAIAIIDSVI